MRRGEVWDIDFPADFPAPAGRRPAVLLTRDGILDRLDTVPVAPVTATGATGTVSSRSRITSRVSSTAGRRPAGAGKSAGKSMSQTSPRLIDPPAPHRRRWRIYE